MSFNKAWRPRPGMELSVRERQVVFHMARDRTVKETARALRCSPGAVWQHRRSIHVKLGGKTARATLYAVREGLVSP